MRYRGRGYPRRPSVAETRRKAERKLLELRKKDADIRPILIEGRAIAKTWWGKAWTTNLERYADFASRIGRGRSYVRNGAVLDLRIGSGEVKSLVQGTRAKPYTIAITIQGIGGARWKKITGECRGRLESLSELLQGQFPKELGELFTARETGIFPSPKEIQFSCSCPDWARTCKHVAATLYGIGTRLDEEPGLFFTMRGVEVDELVSQAVRDTTAELLGKAEKKSARIIEDADLSSVFGIELEEHDAVEGGGSGAGAAPSAVDVVEKAIGRNPCGATVSRGIYVKTEA